ncbi:MAG: ATP-binding protein [Gaiellaceae bacterium]
MAVPTRTSRPVKLTIPARAEFIILGRLALTGLCRARDVPDDVLRDLKLALTEACTNAVRHAYEDGGDGEVEILYELGEDRIAIEVADGGGGFDPPESGNGSSELGEGGLGIAIIKALTDEFEVASAPDGGSRLRFVRFLG